MESVSVPAFWRGRNVLVTGAGGFVGSWLTKALLDRGAAVTVILRDRTSLSNFQLLGLAEQVSTVRGTITDYPTAERALNEYEIDTCFHLAAQALVPVANRSPLSTFESNIRGSWTVLEACRRSKLIERVVIASSDKAYGSQPRLPYTEDMPLLGATPYDASKACTEMLARSYDRTFGLPLAIARCANIYGGGDLNFSRLIPGTIRSALRAERPVIRSDGTPIRDYIHADDAIAAYLALAEQLERPEVHGQAFNFGANRPISAVDLARLILDLSGASHLEPDVRGSIGATEEIARQFLDSTRARTVLSWSDHVTLNDGLRRTIDWYRWFITERSAEPAGVA